MPPTTIDVPADRRNDVLRELLSLYGVKAEAIHHAVDGYLTDEEPLHALLHYRSEMAAAEALIDQLGWQLRSSAGPGRLTGERHLLTEISHAALVSAVEDLNTTLSNVARDGPRIEEIVVGLHRITGLFELLAAAYPSASPRR